MIIYHSENMLLEFIYELKRSVTMTNTMHITKEEQAVKELFIL